MFRRVLIANRGEISLRIIYALKEMGIESVVVYSEADEDSLPVELADYAIRIGPAHPQKSYLNVANIMSAASLSGADAVHPGYGFFAENAEFAEICRASGMAFIGPSPKMLAKMGDKIEAKRAMKEAGIRVLPGSIEPVSDAREALKSAQEVGFPVMLKAASGGGGMGMRLVESPGDFERTFFMAQKEAFTSFGDGRLYIERFIPRTRHIEVQVAGDTQGNVVHFYERDCSLQRRHQKLLEEAPAPGIDRDLRDKIAEAAIKGASYIGYQSVGTLEFLLDEDGNFYFMEMNTRIQVEHPVTEMVTDTDLVKIQILIAAGEPIPFTQDRITLTGHAIEARINSEDPEKNFAPNTGEITNLHKPGGPGVRVDSHIYQGYKIPPFYDSLLAKLIVKGRDRQEAISKMKRALDEFIIKGVMTTIPFHRALMDDTLFKSGQIHTNLVNQLTFRRTKP